MIDHSLTIHCTAASSSACLPDSDRLVAKFCVLGRRLRAVLSPTYRSSGRTRPMCSEQFSRIDLGPCFICLPLTLVVVLHVLCARCVFLRPVMLVCVAITAVYIPPSGIKYKPETCVVLLWSAHGACDNKRRGDVTIELKICRSLDQRTFEVLRIGRRLSYHFQS